MNTDPHADCYKRAYEVYHTTLARVAQEAKHPRTDCIPDPFSEALHAVAEVIKAHVETETARLRQTADEMARVLEGIINSAVHPDTAMRAVLVPLDPVRAALARYREPMSFANASAAPAENPLNTPAEEAETILRLRTERDHYRTTLERARALFDAGMTVLAQGLIAEALLPIDRSDQS